MWCCCRSVRKQRKCSRANGVHNLQRILPGEAKRKIRISNFTLLHLQKHYLSGFLPPTELNKTPVPNTVLNLCDDSSWPSVVHTSYEISTRLANPSASVLMQHCVLLYAFSLEEDENWVVFLKERVSCISLLTKIRYYTGWITFKSFFESKREATSIGWDLTVAFFPPPPKFQPRCWFANWQEERWAISRRCRSNQGNKLLGLLDWRELPWV